MISPKMTCPACKHEGTDFVGIGVDYRLRPFTSVACPDGSHTHGIERPVGLYFCPKCGCVRCEYWEFGGD